MTPAGKTCTDCGTPILRTRTLCDTCKAGRDSARKRAAGAAARALFAEDVEWLLQGSGPELVATRLGTNPAAAARRLYRAGRPDLAMPFQRVATRLRRERERAA